MRGVAELPCVPNFIARRRADLVQARAPEHVVGHREHVQLAVARQVVVRQERDVRVLRARDDVGRRVELRGLHRGARERRVQRHGVVGSCGGEIQAGGVSVFLHAWGEIVFLGFYCAIKTV